MGPEDQKRIEERAQLLFGHLAEPVIEEIAKVLTGHRVLAIVPVADQKAAGGVRYELHLRDGLRVDDHLRDRVKAAIKAVQGHSGNVGAQKIIWAHAGTGTKLVELLERPSLFRAVLADCAEVIQTPEPWKLTEEEIAGLD